MIPSIFLNPLRLVLGTLYPAYASYKAVRTKNVREYVKWMMYWIVFAIFTSIETFADIFVAFWFPFYYEMKILVLLWLISPVSKGSLGSSIIYRKFVHPALMKREEEIDHMILRLQEQGYNTVSRLAGRAFRTVSDFVMQTAIRSAPRLDQLLYDNVDARDPRHLQQDGGFMWNILNDPQTRNPNPNHVAQAVVQAGARGDTASDFLENVDEIDHMDFIPEPEADKKRGRSPRKAANKVAVPQSSVFSSDSEAGPSETPASSDMDVELDPNVTMAVKRRGRPSKKKESSTDAEINEKGGGGLVYQLRKSYSLTDLGNQDEYDEGSPQMMRHSERMRPLPQITDITDECDDDASMTSGGVRRRTRPTTYRQESSTGFRTESSTGYFFPESDIVDLQQQRRLRSTSFRDTPRHVTRPEIASPDGFSSGYSSSTAELAAFLPMSPDEMMDTEDYELYNPRVQGFRGEGPAKSRSFAVRGSPLHSSKGVTPGRGRARPKQEVSHYGTLPRSYPKRTKVQSVFKQST